MSETNDVEHLTLGEEQVREALTVHRSLVERSKWSELSSVASLNTQEVHTLIDVLVGKRRPTVQRCWEVLSSVIEKGF